MVHRAAAVAVAVSVAEKALLSIGPTSDLETLARTTRQPPEGGSRAARFVYGYGYDYVYGCRV